MSIVGVEQEENGDVAIWFSPPKDGYIEKRALSESAISRECSLAVWGGLRKLFCLTEEELEELVSYVKIDIIVSRKGKALLGKGGRQRGGEKVLNKKEIEFIKETVDRILKDVNHSNSRDIVWARVATSYLVGKGYLTLEAETEFLRALNAERRGDKEDGSSADILK
jgi:hypothetical protein